MRDVLEPTDDAAWLLVQHEYDPLREHDAEARFSVGNGFLGVRGAREASSGPAWVSWTHTLNWACAPRTYVAGLFDQPDIEPRVPALIPAPDWLSVTLSVDGEPVRLHAGEPLLHRRTLDMRRGLMLLEWQQRTPNGAVVTLRSLRLVSQADRAIALQRMRIHVSEPGARIGFEAAFPPTGLGLHALRLEQDAGVWRTERSGKGLALASAVALRRGEEELAPEQCGQLRWSWTWSNDPPQVVAFERIVAMVRDDHGMPGNGAARDALKRARRAGSGGVLAAHEAAWTDRWQDCGIEVEGDPAAQHALRFAAYHLASSANPQDERVSIGARAMTGDCYWGHVFWDTEIFLLPFYTLTWPEAARALLAYRYRGLGGARAKAARLGWRGAMYPWECADTGEESSPPYVFGPDGRPVTVLCGEQEQHVSADIAYAVWHYWQVTGDDEFLRDRGAEIMLETARFWTSRADPDAEGRYHIKGVIGPDEYHEGIDDNAFTNVMARWNIRRALDVAAFLRRHWPEAWERLTQALHLDDAELSQWRKAADTLALARDTETGILEQFAGYFRLEDIDLTQYAGRAASIDLVLGRERTQRSQVIKQADVVALLALLPDEFDRTTPAASFGYYERRCAHGSSLSRPMHALVAARLGDSAKALRYFHEAAAADLGDSAGESAGGIRIANLGGLWQVAILGFAGVSWRDGVLCLYPRLPATWKQMRFRLCWQGRHLAFRIDQIAQTIAVTLKRGESLTVCGRGESQSLTPGATIAVPLPDGLQCVDRIADAASALKMPATLETD
ncbi:MAG: glycoside hydrolase family 65 protein [Acetobacteraceae bacterium]|nr:glycoside hydrolase family 65 protein [Acetobacteraceae bacterium]